MRFGAFKHAFQLLRRDWTGPVVAASAGLGVVTAPALCQQRRDTKDGRRSKTAKDLRQEQKDDRLLDYGTADTFSDDKPKYVPEMFRDELGGALAHDTAISKLAKHRLMDETRYPVEQAVLTLAPEVPPPITRKYPVRLVVDMLVKDKLMPVSGNTKYPYWPFGFKDEAGKVRVGVPGPFIRARVGDVMQVNFTNMDSSGMAHNIDFHCVLGPGGGAPATYAEQDETKTGVFLLTAPGLFFYHCAAAPLPVHINNGMFGLALVEPEEGLPPVDKEIYVVQHELYCCDSDDPDDDGNYITDYDAGANETPKHVFFNGREGAMVDKPVVVKQDDRVRLFFGNAGPNLTSAFHIIGAIFDKVYREGDLVSPPGRHIHTSLIPACGTTMIEFGLPVPGTYTLIDHSVFRIDKGAVGMIKVKGRPRPDIYDSAEPPILCPGCKLHQ